MLGDPVPYFVQRELMEREAMAEGWDRAISRQLASGQIQLPTPVRKYRVRWRYRDGGRGEAHPLAYDARDAVFQIKAVEREDVIIEKVEPDPGG
jgi:hypothetical protein